MHPMIRRPSNQIFAVPTRCRTRVPSRRGLLLGLLVSAVAVPACAPLPVGGPVPARGVPGFDTRDYPGARVMRAWRAESPYRWVGFYLPAPCYTGTGWAGQRETLRTMGWGFAVLFVGEQDWAAIRPAAEDTVPVAAPGARCTRANLTEGHGARHAEEAAAAAAASGFPTGTALFLNVERVERVSPELRTYVRSWVRTLLERGRYVPALYAHDHNARELYALLTEEFARQGRAERPRLWVARGAGFDLRRSPAESGQPFATVWQGRFDIRDTWGGTTLTIDVNVADSPDPSRPR
jgi:hypothetical protein